MSIPPELRVFGRAIRDGLPGSGAGEDGDVSSLGVWLVADSSVRALDSSSSFSPCFDEALSALVGPF